MRLRVTALAVAASLAGAAPAAADTFTVTGSGDNSIPAACDPAGAGAWSCTMLRAAVQQANATPGEDAIVITAPRVDLTSASVLTIQDGMTISGRSPRSTTIDASGVGGPAFRVDAPATVTFGNLTIQGGSGTNVNVLAGSDVGFAFVRLTASTGVGLVNEGSATLVFSLVDRNPTGGINNVGSGTAAAVIVGSSTIAGNGGNAITSTANPQNEVSLNHATIARNTGAGVFFDSGHQPGDATASILADNDGGNCSGGTLTGTFNVESTTSCALTGENKVAINPQLATALSYQGGFTDVLTIPAGSPGADYVSSLFCVLGQDQRGFRTPVGQPCDAGAYDHDGTDPGIAGDPQPTPTPQPPAPPQPTPTPSPTPTPTPVPNQSVVGDEVRGTVTVKLPGAKGFIDLDDARSLPNGTEIDTRKGAIKLKAVPKPGKPPEEATFYDGLFKVSQRGGVTTLTLSEALDCPNTKGKKASLAARKVKKRKLWGDGKGAFRTQGKYSAATVRGTKWLVEDTCTTTTVKVVQGAVTVQDLVKKKRVVVRAPKQYVARAKP